MARIRSIKPEFWQDEKIAKLPHWNRLLYIGLWNLADDFGRLRGNNLLIRAQVFPYEHDVDIEVGLKALENGGQIQRYFASGESYLFVCNFAKHQKIDTRGKSKLPVPPKPAKFPPVPANKLVEPADFTPVPAEKKPRNREQGGEQGTGSLEQVTEQVGKKPPPFELKPTGPKEKKAPPHVQFIEWAQDERIKAFPLALREAIGDKEHSKYSTRYAACLDAVSGDSGRMSAAWLRYLDDNWATNCSPPCPLAGFFSDPVFRRCVPGQASQPEPERPRCSIPDCDDTQTCDVWGVTYCYPHIPAETAQVAAV